MSHNYAYDLSRKKDKIARERKRKMKWLAIVTLTVALVIMSYKVSKLEKYVKTDVKVSQGVVQVLQKLIYKTRNLR